jgi:hypothetical protein
MKTLALIVAFVLAIPVASAAEPPRAFEQAEREMREGLDRILRALDGLVRSIPMYDAPVIDKEGNIIIKRRRPAPEPPDRAPESNDTAGT